MSEVMSLVSIVAALIIGTMSPGPSFVVVARIAVAKSRAHGMSAALGMGMGGMLFAALALLGLQGLLMAVPSVYVTLKVVGGIYLCYLGFRIYLSARNPLEIKLQPDDSTENLFRSFALGLVTQVSNPKTAIVYASVFATFLPGTISPTLGLAIMVSVFFIETGWYAIVAMSLAANKPRKIYLTYKAWIDKTAGLVLGALGAKLFVSSSA